MTRFRRGFTLVEMLVVITIIGMLTSLLLPAALRARESGRRVRCANNLHQLALGMTNYETQYRTFPPGRVGCDCDEWGPCRGVPAYKRAGTSGFALILPQIDEAGLYSLFRSFAKGAIFPGDTLPQANDGAEGDSSVGWTSAKCGTDNTTTSWNTGTMVTVVKAYSTRPPVFVCPSDPVGDPPRYGPDESDASGNDIRPAVGSYAMNMGPLGPETFNEGTASGKYPSYSASTIKYRASGQSGEVQVKYQNLGPFVYYYARGSQQVLDGLTTTIFLGEVKDGTDSRYQFGGAPNRWAAAWALADSLRSTYNGIDYAESYRFADSVVQKGRKFGGFFGSNHGPGANFAFGDGHVQWLQCTIDLLTLYALSTINNGYYEATNSAGTPITLP
jgi:prepilin-type N-terminal cleavage/methylation domain-containing protein/prepilin-type processing-associated H-X9-DG protein